MAMPEATVHEHDSIVFPKRQIRTAGNVLCMQPIAKTSPVQRLSQHEFRPRVLAPDAGHDPGSRLAVNDIHQGLCSTCTFGGFNAYTTISPFNTADGIRDGFNLTINQSRYGFRTQREAQFSIALASSGSSGAGRAQVVVIFTNPPFSPDFRRPVITSTA